MLSPHMWEEAAQYNTTMYTLSLKKKNTKQMQILKLQPV